MELAQLPRLVRTVRHLRWSQVVARLEKSVELRFRVLMPAKNQVTRRVPSRLRLADQFPLLLAANHAHPPANDELLDQLASGVFSHLNQSQRLGYEVPDWRLGPLSKSRLWTVTLHYHAWAYSLADYVVQGGDRAETAAHLLEHYLSDWIFRVSPTNPSALALAWNSYAIATRIPWWIRTWMRLGEKFFDNRPQFRELFLGSLWQQANHLHRHLEWDLRANHLLRDLVGLAWAGRFLDGVEPKMWLLTATRHLEQQIREQVLPDGGHFERSPSYHAEVLQDFCELSCLVEDSRLANLLQKTVAAMSEYQAWLRHPDGRFAQFNDGGRGETGRLDRRGAKYFADTGVVVWHGSTWSVFFDVGEIGPAFQPGHGHADTLTLECSIQGKRLFVDPGCFNYDHDETRRYDRSTEAHNTVCVDESNSSEVWHIFRCGRRATPYDVEVKILGDGIQAKGTHDGYAHLPGAPTHCRRLFIQNEHAMLIEDEVSGSGHHRLEGGWLLDVGWQIRRDGDTAWVVSKDGAQVRVAIQGPRGIVMSCEPRPLHPEFGIAQETSRLTWRYSGDLPVRVCTRVEPLSHG